MSAEKTIIADVVGGVAKPAFAVAGDAGVGLSICDKGANPRRDGASVVHGHVWEQLRFMVRPLCVGPPRQKAVSSISRAKINMA